MSYVGVTGNDGNLGTGSPFDYTVGNIDNEGIVNRDGWITLAGIASVPFQDSIYSLTGRASFGTVPSDNSNNSHGSWLIAKVPEPSIFILMIIGFAGLGLVRQRQQQTQ